MARPYMVTSDQRTIDVRSWSEAAVQMEVLKDRGDTGVEVHTR